MSMTPWNSTPTAVKPRERRTDLLDWWMRELNSRLKDYVALPNDAKRDVLLKLLQDYRLHVEDGAVKPPRFSE